MIKSKILYFPESWITPPHSAAPLDFSVGRIFPLKRGIQRSVLWHVSHWRRWSSVCEVVVVVFRRGGGREGVVCGWKELLLPCTHTYVIFECEDVINAVYRVLFLWLNVNRNRRKRGGFVLKVSLIKVVYYEVVEYRGGVCSWCKEKVAAGVDNPGSCCVWLGRNGAPSWTPWGFGCDGCVISMLYMWWDNQLLQERTLAYCQATASAAFISSLKGTYQHRATSWSQAQVQLFVCIILIILFIIKCQVQRQ